MLDEAAAVGAQVVALDEQGEQRVQLVEGVEDAQQVARAPVRGEDEEVAQGGRDEGGELLLGEDFCDALGGGGKAGGWGRREADRRERAWSCRGRFGERRQAPC